MKVVIEIPEDDYKVFVRQRCNDSTPICRLYKAIKNGTVLQNGHGRIIDESDIEWAKFRVESKYFEYDELVNWIDIKSAPTIIPKDGDTES